MSKDATPPDATGRPPAVDHLLLVNALANADVQLLTLLSKRIADAGCNVHEARVFNLGREVSVLLLVGGSWDAIAKFESALTRMQRDEQIVIASRRTQAKPLAGTTLPYVIEIVAADKPGVLAQLADFFARRGIAVETLSSSRYKAPLTGAEMFSAQLTIGIPVTSHIASLRDDFLDFCDAQNLDAILEPVKN